MHCIQQCHALHYRHCKLLLSYQCLIVYSQSYKTQHRIRLYIFNGRCNWIMLLLKNNFYWTIYNMFLGNLRRRHRWPLCVETQQRCSLLFGFHFQQLCKPIDWFANIIFHLDKIGLHLGNIFKSCTSVFGSYDHNMRDDTLLLLPERLN